MFTFDDYKKLSCDIKTIVTIYWSHTVRVILGVSTSTDVLKAHLYPSRKPYPNWEYHDTNFWKKKFSGEPVNRKNKIEQTDDLLNENTISIFIHPFWQIIELDNIKPSMADKVILSLSPEIFSRLYERTSYGTWKRKKTNRSSNLRKIALMRNIDALTCWLAIILEEKLITGVITEYHRTIFDQLCFDVYISNQPFREIADLLVPYLTKILRPPPH